MVGIDREWKWNLFSDLLHAHVLLRIVAVKPPLCSTFVDHPGWNGFSRVKTFLWLLAHERILTKSKRLRRHLDSDDKCWICGNNVETIRDCSYASAILRKVGLARLCHSVFAQDMSDWLRTYLSAKDFSPMFNCDCHLLLGYCYGLYGFIEILLSLFRIIWGASPPWPCAIGLLCNIAWRVVRLVRPIEVELDSLNFVRILHGSVGVGAHSNLIHHIHEILRQDWEITFSHIFHEENTIADELAKMDTSGHVGGCIFRHSPPDVRDLVLHEMGLISLTRSSLALSVGVT
ncbi:hypothetical protein V6N12_065161 [Hibiscus sabdariffa]|uniref:RNase H type-1 domain-containing protein n=1 Tax=Hibiscus sabdariffa TaxID=183260 RepID=A0ABR2G7X4_9ROSI